MEYDQQVIERNQQLAYQGILANCKDVGITKVELQGSTDDIETKQQTVGNDKL